MAKNARDTHKPGPGKNFTLLRLPCLALIYDIADGPWKETCRHFQCVSNCAWLAAPVIDCAERA